MTKTRLAAGNSMSPFGALAPCLRVLGVLSLFAFPTDCAAQSDIESPPFEYSKTQDSNCITALNEKLKSGDIKLTFDRDQGYLKSLLKALDIPVSSQSLVFSKTSMQLAYISPRSPRAIYFNDDVYVAWVQGSPIMEISTSDPKLGAAFYTLRMSPRRAHFRRQLYDCLACHISTLTQGVPGHTVRSVLPNPDGTIDAQSKSFVTDHTSPLAERWGGWYVTGKHGDMLHMGNAIVRGGQLQTNGNGNRADLTDRFHTPDWLSPYSDIVALMVLEHQTQMHNTFTLANFAVRQAEYDHAQAYGGGTLAAEVPVPPDALQELQFSIRQSAKQVVDYMLFVNEASLTSEIRRSTPFAEEFAARGPADPEGRSLRDFDLKTRLFRHPCSYMIYSPAFDALEESLRNEIYLHLWNVLTSRDESDEYADLTKDARRSILDILRQTKRQLPAYWAASQASG